MGQTRLGILGIEGKMLHPTPGGMRDRWRVRRACVCALMCATARMRGPCGERQCRCEARLFSSLFLLKTGGPVGHEDERGLFFVGSSAHNEALTVRGYIKCRSKRIEWGGKKPLGAAEFETVASTFGLDGKDGVV